jgi:hypothetical protein
MSAVLPSVDTEEKQVKKQQPKRESAASGDVNTKARAASVGVDNGAATRRELVMVEVPLAEPRPGYASRRLDLRMTRKQSVAAQRLYLGLMEMEAKLENGAPVNNVSRAVAWLLERV